MARTRRDHEHVARLEFRGNSVAHISGIVSGTVEMGYVVTVRSSWHGIDQFRPGQHRAAAGEHVVDLADQAVFRDPVGALRQGVAMHKRYLHLRTPDIERANLHVAHRFALPQAHVLLNFFQ